MPRKEQKMADLFDRLGTGTEEDVEVTVKKQGRVWSSYQLAIFRNIAEGKGHTVIIAKAGSGKSTCLIEGFNHVPKGLTVLMCAFNKSIATDLKARVSKNVEVSTLHSYGLRAVTKAFGRLTINDKKVDSMVRVIRGDHSGTFDARRAICKIVSLSKSNLAETIEQVSNIVDGHTIEGFGDMPKDREAAINDSLLILKACKDPSQESSVFGQTGMGEIDFDDMVWLPVVCAIRPWQYDRVFIEECQDMNPAQIELSLRAAKPNGRICVVGDPAQSIYSFMGADSRSIPSLIERLRAHVMPLSVTYRCPVSVVEEARRYVPDIEAAPNAEQGEVLHCFEEKMKMIAEPGDVIISRINAPLIPLCLGFLRENRRAAVRGRDVGTSLASLIKKSKADNIVDLTLWVQTWGARECARLRKKEMDTQTIEDKVATVDALCEGAQSVQEVLSRIEALFSDSEDGNRIVLSTCHKYKGGEADRIFMLRDTFLRKDTEEERNLAYVAITRSKKSLYYVRKAHQ